MIEILAQQPTTGPAAGPDSSAYSLLHLWGPMIIIIAMMYFVLWMPKRRQDKQRQQMLDTMKRGDEVQTIGGVIGKVVDPREDRVLVKVDESSNTKIWFSRSAIARVTAEDTKDAKTAATTK